MVIFLGVKDGDCGDSALVPSTELSVSVALVPDERERDEGKRKGLYFSSPLSPRTDTGTLSPWEEFTFCKVISVGVCLRI